MFKGSVKLGFSVLRSYPVRQEWWALFLRLPCTMVRVGCNVRDMVGEVGSVPNGQCHDQSLSHPAAPPHPGPRQHGSSPFARRMFQS